MSKKIPDSFIDPLIQEYKAGTSLASLARKCRKERRTLRGIFQRRGVHIRPVPYTIKRGYSGQFAPAKPLTTAQLDKLIAGLTRVCVPESLKREWRLWPMSKRMWFIRRAFERFPSDRPAGPLSPGMKFFDYGTPEAREIIDRKNWGRNSRNKRASIKPCSQGIIFEGELYFWMTRRGESRAAYFVGSWKPGIGRPSLHQTLWQRYNGRKQRENETVIFKDGNKNNFRPENLVLRSRADCARQNISIWRLKRSRENTALLLKRSTRHDHDSSSSTIHRLARNRPRATLEAA